MKTFAGRTIHGVPRHARNLAADPVLRVIGDVGSPLSLRPEDLANLSRSPYIGSLSCVEGGNVPETDWSGMVLADLVSLAAPHPDARFVRVCAGPYAVPIPLDECQSVLLCDQLAGEALAPEDGGPWRLVVPGSRYYTSVKWVDRLEITADEPDNSAERIAQARARARSARHDAE